jgi:hypothetical protein
MERIAYYAQNDTIEALRAAEREALRKAGAPDVDALVFVSMIPEDRGEILVECEATPAFMQWLRNKEMTFYTNEEDEE